MANSEPSSGRRSELRHVKLVLFQLSLSTGLAGLDAGAHIREKNEFMANAILIADRGWRHSQRQSMNAPPSRAT